MRQCEFRWPHSLQLDGLSSVAWVSRPVQELPHRTRQQHVSGHLARRLEAPWAPGGSDEPRHAPRIVLVQLCLRSQPLRRARPGAAAHDAVASHIVYRSDRHASWCAAPACVRHHARWVDGHGRAAAGAGGHFGSSATAAAPPAAARGTATALRPARGTFCRSSHAPVRATADSNRMVNRTTENTRTSQLPPRHSLYKCEKTHWTQRQHPARRRLSSLTRRNALVPQKQFLFPAESDPTRPHQRQQQTPKRLDFPLGGTNVPLASSCLLQFQ